ADDVDVGARGLVDRADVRQLEPAVGVLHELLRAAGRLAILAIRVLRHDRHEATPLDPRGPERLRSMVGDATAFREQIAAFVHDRYALDPTAATIAGLHDHDARLADLSA